MPEIIGAYEDTRVPIMNPGGVGAAQFMNKKEWYSLNCQLVCNSNLLVDATVRLTI